MYIYRHRPHKIEAVRWRRDLPANLIPAWLWVRLDRRDGSRKFLTVDGGVRVNTPAGSVLAREGDYIVKTNLNEFLVVPADEFERDYEPDNTRNQRTRVWRSPEGGTQRRKPRGER